jgi:hypothetical protein
MGKAVLTNELIAYFNELERSLEYIRETAELSLDEKKRFFKSANANLGKQAVKDNYRGGFKMPSRCYCTLFVWRRHSGLL